MEIPSPKNPRLESYVFRYPEEKVDLWTNCISQMSVILSPARNYSQNKKTRKKVNLAWRNRKLALRETCCGLCFKSFWHQETGCGLYLRFFQPSVLHKKNDCCCLFNVQRRIYLQNWSQDWCAIMTKKNDNLRQQFIGTR